MLLRRLVLPFLLCASTLGLLPTGAAAAAARVTVRVVGPGVVHINLGKATTCTEKRACKVSTTRRSLRLTARALAGAKFTSWNTGCKVKTTASCTLRVRAGKRLNITARFASSTTAGGTTGTGTGSVTPPATGAPTPTTPGFVPEGPPLGRAFPAGTGVVGAGAVSVPAVPTGFGTTYYIRTDGGTAAQCNGRTNAAYPGSGTAQSCAWGSLLVALPVGGPARIAGGDMILLQPGEHRVGYGATGATGCSTDFPWDCTPTPLPSGPDAAHPTRLVGAGYDSGCSAPQAQLYGAERAQILSLTNTNHAVVSCIEMTDHSSCIEAHSNPDVKCKRDVYPFGDWSGTALYAQDSTDVTLSNLDIHGMADGGIHAGRLTDWSLINVRIATNGWAGFDGDVIGDDHDHGTILLRGVSVEWNGCGERYPQGTVYACWGQSAGGYGDGLGTGATGADWVVEDSSFRHNVSDGLDLLYHDNTGSVTIRRVWSEGNSGNQIKAHGKVSITNLVAIGNCAFLGGKPFTWGVDDCRALGDTVAINSIGEGADSSPGTPWMSISHSTIIGEGNVAVYFNGDPGSTLRLRNNIIAGQLPGYFAPDHPYADAYTDSTMTLDEAYDTKFNLRHQVCTGTGVVCADPGLVSTSPATPDPHLTAGSIARNSALVDPLINPATDIFGTARPQGGAPDRGAIETP